MCPSMRSCRSAHGPATGARLRPRQTLRALAVQGNDTKFLNATPACSPPLLDERFDGEASRQGWWGFGRTARRRPLAAHRPAGPGLLPFAQMRVRASELLTTPLPAGRILLVETTLPAPTARPVAQQDTIAVLGAGLNLGWLAAPWLQERSVVYWGDLDTWGLHAGHGRHHLCRTLHALLMDAPPSAPTTPWPWPNRCTPRALCRRTDIPKKQRWLSTCVRRPEDGWSRSLPTDTVHRAVRTWVNDNDGLA